MGLVRAVTVPAFATLRLVESIEVRIRKCVTTTNSENGHVGRSFIHGLLFLLRRHQFETISLGYD